MLTRPFRVLVSSKKSFTARKLCLKHGFSCELKPCKLVLDGIESF